MSSNLNEISFGSEQPSREVSVLDPDTPILDKVVATEWGNPESQSCQQTTPTRRTPGKPFMAMVLAAGFWLLVFGYQKINKIEITRNEYENSTTCVELRYDATVTKYDVNNQDGRSCEGPNFDFTCDCPGTL